MQSIKTKNWIMALAGIWAIIAPFALHYVGTTTALWNDMIVGVVVLLLAVLAAVVQDNDNVRNLDWVNAVLGVWLILSPFILGYSVLMAAMWSDIITGVVIVALAVWTEIELPNAIGQPSS